MSQVRTIGVRRGLANRLGNYACSNRLFATLPQRNLSGRELAPLLYAKKKVLSAPVKIRPEDFKEAADAIKPKNLRSPGARRVATELKKILRSRRLGDLAQIKVAEATSFADIVAFRRDCGARDFYMALGVLLPTSLSRKVLGNLFVKINKPSFLKRLESILEECIELKKTYPIPIPKPTKKEKQNAAKAIDPEVFKDHPGAIRVARYIRRVLMRGKLELLERDYVGRQVGNQSWIDVFAKMCVGNCSFYHALASLVKDRKVMDAILYACGITRDREEILANCGSFNGVILEHLNNRSRAEREKRDEGEGIIDWAREIFGEKVEVVKRLGKKVEEEQLKELRWKRAKVYYWEDRGNRLGIFCEKYGGQRGEIGWYKALQKAFGLTKEQIELIQWGNLE